MSKDNFQWAFIKGILIVTNKQIRYETDRKLFFKTNKLIKSKSF